ncbi:MAG: radical SAM protein [Anaerolineae bacterium]|nr:radical SAM protein [Anaerolineae bacterium]
MIKEIQARVMLSHVRQPDTWFGLKYNMNIYRGCQHQCIYCDSRSECYQIENFSDVLVKVNAIDLLKRELPSKRVRGMIGTGSMSDPYTPVEKTYNLTGQALELFALYRFPVHIITKSDLVLKDLDTLVAINQTRANVTFTVTAADDDLAAKVEPGAPRPSARFEAMAKLAAHGIHTGVTLMPILPFIEDSKENIGEILRQASDSGVTYVIASLGMTLRDRQRAYYYDKLDRLFPGVRDRYRARYGDRYSCPANEVGELWEHFHALCEAYKLSTRIDSYQPGGPVFDQLPLFE